MRDIIRAFGGLRARDHPEQILCRRHVPRRHVYWGGCLPPPARMLIISRVPFWSRKETYLLSNNCWSCTISHNPLTLLGIRLKSAMIVKNERTGMTDTLNWTDGDDLPRGIEIGCFFGLFTRICRFSSPFLKIAFFLFYTSKNCHFSGSIFSNLFIAFWNGRINLSKCTFQSDLRGQNGLYAPFFLRTTIYVKIPFQPNRTI